MMKIKKKRDHLCFYFAFSARVRFQVFAVCSVFCVLHGECFCLFYNVLLFFVKFVAGYSPFNWRGIPMETR